MLILDTTVLIDLLKKKPAVIQKIKELEAQGVSISTTVISVFEIIQGLNKKTSKGQEEKIFSIFSSMPVFSLDIQSSIEAGKISQSLLSAGAVIQSQDCMIAGIAKMQNETILARNQKHFSRIPKIEVETY